MNKAKYAVPRNSTKAFAHALYTTAGPLNIGNEWIILYTGYFNKLFNFILNSLFFVQKSIIHYFILDIRIFLLIFDKIFHLLEQLTLMNGTKVPYTSSEAIISQGQNLLS